jgi:glucosamine--fructose-6-phosphate aminotransferase (isomerizing)
MQVKSNTLPEILGQSKVWSKCLGDLASADLQRLVEGYDPGVTEWVFVGCGTSYYLAQAAAATVTELFKARSRAVPASEILLNPKQVFPYGAADCFPVLISRSGHTSEVLKVAENLNQQKVPFLAVTCDGRELEHMTPRVLKMDAHEKSVVMTTSFTSMLLGLQYLAATVAGDKKFIADLESLPGHLDRLVKIYAPLVEDFIDKNISLDDFAFLGQGGLYAIACEMALKVMETSSSYAQYFHTLEFRHGPKSIAGPKTLIGGLISESSYDVEMPVLAEMKELGSPIMAITNKATASLREAADLLIELNLPVAEMARLIVYVVWGQMFGCYRSLAMGMDPDNPRFLSRVVTI